ncbi:MAG: metallophosphoesterase family protein [Sulfolobales archaeon]
MKLLIVSDIHGNADALKTLLDVVEGWDHIWFLGDLVDYGPEPHVVIELVKDLKPDLVLMGNHDYAVAYNTDCRCAPELHELSEYTRVNISLKLLTKDQINWLKNLSLRHNTSLDGLKVYAVHGSPRNNLYGYLKPTLPLDEIKLALTPNIYAVRPDLVDADYVIVGHTHIPMELSIENLKVLNPGSVGQPRDGDPRASALILDLDTKELKWYRVEYDVENTIKKLMSLGLDLKYVKWLETILKSGSIFKPTSTIS